MEQDTAVLEEKPKHQHEKKVKRKKPWWKKLLVFIVIIGLLWTAGHYFMVFFGHIVVQNLSSISAPIDSGKVHVSGMDGEREVQMVRTAHFLSAVSYEPGSAVDDVSTEMENSGYSNIQRVENTPSYLYHNFWIKRGKDMNFLFTSVNAIIATKPVTVNGTEKTMIAIAFRGTNPANAVDDVSDLLIAKTSDGIHRGFEWNAENFYKKCDDIIFSLDGKAITLADVFAAAKKPDCPYMIFVTGHSLGGAVAGVLVGKTLYDTDILPENIFACTFGTPKSVSSDYMYPYDNIINIINEDDVVPTIGCEKQLGNNLVFHPTDEFRKNAYGGSYTTGAVLGDYNSIVSAAATGFRCHDIQTSYKEIALAIAEEPNAYFTDEKE